MSCQDQYIADMKVCNDTFQAEFAQCLTLPTSAEQQACLQAAQARRNQCEAAAYLKYVNCVGQQSAQGGCRCGGGE